MSRDPDARVDINVRISQERAQTEEDRFEDDFEDEMEASDEPSAPQSTGTIVVSRASTSRYRTYQDVVLHAGMTVAEIREKLYDDYDLHEKMVAVRKKTDGSTEMVGDDYCTKEGDHIHFASAPKDRGDE
jgi:hypothetical protein